MIGAAQTSDFSPLIHLVLMHLYLLFVHFVYFTPPPRQKMLQERSFNSLVEALLKALCPNIRAACYYIYKHLKSTAKRDEYGRHTRTSASLIDHAVSRAHSQLSIDRSQRAYDGR